MSAINLSNIENNFQLLVKRCRLLYNEKQKLEQKVLEGQEEIARQQTLLEELEEKVRMLKMTSPAGNMPQDGSVRKEMRTALNAYIQEIDNCIALLNK